MLELLTGSGLATAAGLNAYVPLLIVGGANALWPSVISLPNGWQWLSNPWVIAVLAVLLVIEVVADKVPALDTVNDVVQTVVRPTAGGLAFGSVSGATTAAVKDPSTLLSNNQWIPIVIGVVIALLVHGGKMAVRPLANAATGGVAAPVMSTVEDMTSVGLSFIALIIPVLVVLVLIGLIWAGVAMRRRGQRRAAAKAARAEAKAGVHRAGDPPPTP